VGIFDIFLDDILTPIEVNSMCISNKYFNKISMLGYYTYYRMMNLSILILCLFIVSCSVQPVQSTKRVALVIGNDYAGTPLKLKSPVRDAKAMKNALRKVGFHVFYLENANQSEMNDALNTFVKELDEHTDGLFYFSGHGISGAEIAQKSNLPKEVNYLIPNNKSIYSTTTLIEPETLIAFRDVVRKMHESKNHLNIVIIDACRSQGVKVASLGDKGLKQEVADIFYDPSKRKTFFPTNLFVGYATLPNNPAREFGNASVYTKHILERIPQRGISITSLFDQVRESVKQEYSQKRKKIRQGHEAIGEAVPDLTYLQQLPEHLPLIEEDFYFAGETKKTPKIDTF
jgi:hypothetical protein